MINSEGRVTCLRPAVTNGQSSKTKFSQSTILRFKILTATLVVSFICQAAHAEHVSLAWEACDGATGYKVYYGYKSRNYPFVVDVGLETECTITYLDADQIYYITVTAYNEYGESDYSEELIYSSSMCENDFDGDEDIDGIELSEIIYDIPSSNNLRYFASAFGNVNCEF